MCRRRSSIDTDVTGLPGALQGTVEKEEAQHSRAGDQDPSVVIPETAGPDKNTNWKEYVCLLLCAGPGTKAQWFISLYKILFLVVVTVIKHTQTHYYKM